MAYLVSKLTQLKKALMAWKEVLNKPYSDIVRDAAIQRFEFSFELLWKALKVYLNEQEGITCSSPKACFRELRNLLYLKPREIELCLKMIDDRNLSVHVYSEKLAKELYERLKPYFRISEKLYKELKKKA